MKKTFTILIALALVLSFSLVMATPVAAATLTVDTGQPPVHPNYHTIQLAVAASGSGDDIQVASGTYGEGQIVILHNLTIVGASPKPVINPTGNLPGDNAGNAWILVNAGVTFTLQNVVMDGSILFVHQAIRNHGLTTVDSVDFLNIQGSVSGSPYRGMAIQSYGGTVSGGGGSDSHSGGLAASTLTVTGCTFQQIGRIGVLVKGTSATASVSDCTYTGKGAGDWLDYGVEAGGGGAATITRNTITNCGISTCGWACAAILVTTYYGAGTTATITGNTLTGNEEAIAHGYNAADTSAVTANFNNIYGNTDGIYNASTAVTTDATHNWWGDNSGPGPVGPGTGDGVSTYVDYDPWLGAKVTDQPAGCTADRATGATASPSTDNVSGAATGGSTDTTVYVAEYVGNPTGSSPGFHGSDCFFDVHVSGTLPTQLVIEANCSGEALRWFDGTDWQDVDPVEYVSGTLTATLDNSTSSPLISELTGSPFGLGTLSVVGFETHPISKLGVLLPWIVLLAAIIAGASLLVVRRRRAQI